MLYEALSAGATYWSEDKHSFVYLSLNPEHLH